jgi:hypothetical protein
LIPIIPLKFKRHVVQAAVEKWAEKWVERGVERGVEKGVEVIGNNNLLWGSHVGFSTRYCGFEFGFFDWLC